MSAVIFVGIGTAVVIVAAAVGGVVVVGAAGASRGHGLGVGGAIVDDRVVVIGVADDYHVVITALIIGVGEEEHVVGRDEARQKRRHGLSGEGDYVVLLDNWTYIRAYI